MKKMDNYAFAKLSEINYQIATHEGDAIRRLASQTRKILLIVPEEVPADFQKDFDTLQQVCRKELERLSAPGLTPTRIRGIRNVTAVKYIRLLYLIEHSQYL